MFPISVELLKNFSGQCSESLLKIFDLFVDDLAIPCDTSSAHDFIVEIRLSAGLGIEELEQVISFFVSPCRSARVRCKVIMAGKFQNARVELDGVTQTFEHDTTKIVVEYGSG